MQKDKIALDEIEVEYLDIGNIERKEICWLWHPYIARGKLTILQGEPGTGKTTFILNLIAALTNGKNIDGNLLGSAFKVIYQTDEGDYEDTILRQLDAYHTNYMNFHVINEATKELTVLDKRIEKAVMEKKADLIVIDPIQSYLAPCDMNKANEVRHQLKNLIRVAQTYNCAIVLLGHLNKATGFKAIHRGMGSMDFIAASRCVLTLGVDPSNENIRVLLHTKANLSKKASPVAFTINDNTSITYLGTYDISEDEVMSGISSNSSLRKIDLAKKLILESLSKGKELPQETLKQLAIDNGISERTLYEAKKLMKIRSKKVGTIWYWFKGGDV